MALRFHVRDHRACCSGVFMDPLCLSGCVVWYNARCIASVVCVLDAMSVLFVRRSCFCALKCAHTFPSGSPIASAS